jgi:hypothetical protein
MPGEKAKKGSGRATLARVRKEMAKLRVAKSVRQKYSNLGLPLPIAKEKR